MHRSACLFFQPLPQTATKLLSLAFYVSCGALDVYFPAHCRRRPGGGAWTRLESWGNLWLPTCLRTAWPHLESALVRRTLLGEWRRSSRRKTKKLASRKVYCGSCGTSSPSNSLSGHAVDGVSCLFEEIVFRHLSSIPRLDTPAVDLYTARLRVFLLKCCQGYQHRNRPRRHEPPSSFFGCAYDVAFQARSLVRGRERNPVTSLHSLRSFELIALFCLLRFAGSMPLDKGAILCIFEHSANSGGQFSRLPAKSPFKFVNHDMYFESVFSELVVPC